jgi:molecular chaperone DnaJ
MDHPVFKRNGLDIHCNIEITPAMALYGDSIQIEGPAGEKIPVKIPENTQAGDQIRVPGRGFAGPSKRGDLVMNVVIVSELNPKESNTEFLRQKIRSEWLN